MKFAKSIIGVSTLAAALALAPAAFAGPCNNGGSNGGNSAYNGESENGFQNSSMASPDRESGNWNENQNQNSSVGTMDRNSRLTHEANSAIEHDSQLRNGNVHAWVDRDGVVVLRGETDSAAAALHAQRVIAQYTGVKKFDNELYYPGMYGENANNQKASNGNTSSENAGNSSSQDNAPLSTESQSTASSGNGGSGYNQ